jgi:tetratricopeptide (TPR) repeat protein
LPAGSLPDKAEQHELEERLSRATSPEEIATAKEHLAETTGLAYERCSGCGSISTLPAFFRATRKGALCPRCQERSWPRQHARLLVTLGILLFLLLPAMAWTAQFETSYSAGWVPVLPELRWSLFLVLNPVLVLVLASLLVIPHELSHAAATWSGGGRILEIRIFEGPVRWRTRVRGTNVALGSYPLTGHCIPVFRNRDRIRERTLLMVAAGPLFNIVFLLALLPFYDGSQLASSGAWPELLLVANALLLISALIPYRASLGGRQGLSDGFQFLSLLSGKYSEPDLHLSYLTTEAAHLLRERHYQRALEICEAGLAHFPAHSLLENSRAVALLEMGHHRQALDIFEELLARAQCADEPEQPGITGLARDHVEALLLNNVAYASLLSDSAPQALQRARICARHAWRMTPWLREIQGTWGAVLIETGDVEEGLTHVAEAAREADTARAKAANLAVSAIGHYRLGKKDEAARLLKEARHLDPTGQMVTRAQGELALLA